MLNGPLSYALMSSAGGPVFTPDTLPNLLAYIDPALGVTDDSGASEAIDQSSAGNTVSQSTSINRMAMTTGGGRDMFQGATGDYLTRASFVGGSQPYPTSVYIVVETPSSWSGNQYVFSGPTRNDVLFDSSGNVTIAAGGGLTTSSAVGTSTLAVVRAIFNNTSSSIRVEPNGASVITASGAAGSSDLDGIHIGGLTVIASFLGKIGPLVIVDGELSSENDDLLLTWMRDQYGIVTA